LQTKIEGLLINKVIYRERDIIGHLLLRNGEKVSLLFFGGRGGGAKSKPSLLELGYLLKIELKKNSKKEEGMYIAQEWQTIWTHEKIRYEYKAYSLMTFFLELTNRISQNSNLEEQTHFEQEGVFRVLSNSLFYLEKSLNENQFNPLTHLVLFLCKLTFEMGITPDPFECTFCGIELDQNNLFSFEMQEGGFCCRGCLNKDQIKSNMVDMAVGQDLNFWMSLRTVWNLKYQDYQSFNLTDRAVSDKLYHYFCFQFQIDPSSLKSFALLSL
jgi:DNA repair protein RecO